MLDAVTGARDLIRIVVNDPGVPAAGRRRAGDLESMAASEPTIVLERLEKLRSEVVPTLPSWPPQCDYARCVPVERFWRYHIRPSVRDVFEDGEDYRVYLEDSADPAAVARAHLPGGVLVEAPYSWLVPANLIAGKGGSHIKRLLNVNDEPPYLVMNFPQEAMRDAGVLVREPCGLDTVPGKQTQWSSGDVPDERIDQDIPLSALGSLRWQP